MFDLGGFAEITIIVVAALILIGPRELPKVLHTLGRWSQKLQRFKDHLSQDLNHHFYEGKFEEYQQKANQEILNHELLQRQDLPDKIQNETHPLEKDIEKSSPDSPTFTQSHDKS